MTTEPPAHVDAIRQMLAERVGALEGGLKIALDEIEAYQRHRWGINPGDSDELDAAKVARALLNRQSPDAQVTK